MNNYQSMSYPTALEQIKAYHNPLQFWKASGLEGILYRCCLAFGVTVEDVKSKSREECKVFARQAYCYLAYQLTSQSASKIGELITRDHAAVSYSIKAVNNYLFSNYRRFTNIYNTLLSE